MKYVMIFVLLLCHGVQAKTNHISKVNVTVAHERVSVGLINTITIEVLVPTWFKQPVYFDEVDGLNLINVKTNKSTYPTSKMINGKTWSGVNKTYSVIAMAEGDYQLALPRLKVLFVGQNQTVISEDITLGMVAFNAYIPEQAKKLKPLLIAEQITLSDVWHGQDKRVVGQSITRKVVVEIQGSSALFLPQMLHRDEHPQWQSYPRIMKNENHIDSRTGQLMSKRTESTDVMIRQSGELILPPIVIEYYQPSSGQIVRVQSELDALSISPSAGDWRIYDWLWLFITLMVVSALFLLAKRAWHVYQLSETAHYRRVLKQLHKPSQQVRIEMLDWLNLIANAQSEHEQNTLLLLLDKVIYQNASTQCVIQKMAEVRAKYLGLKKQKREQLPPLNP